jgi:hypothetical protein
MSLRILTPLAVAAFLVPFVAAGCSSSSTSGGAGSCTPGAMQSCACSSGSGTATCDSAGVYGECVCESGGADSSVQDTGTSTGADTGSPSDDSSTAPDGDHCSGCGDGGGLGDASPLDAAAGAFGSMCTQDSDCTSMDCSQFPAKGGGFCTVPCTQASDCPAQAQGCNGMGQCKVP